ncbi:MAG: transposase [Vulcanimicrobiota bacterium]
MAQEYDSPWKEALHVYFPQFLELLFPEVYLAIDWSLGWQVKETELLSPAAGPRRVDVLMQVTMTGGMATLILIHIEVQNQTKQDFPERLFDYHYRIRLGLGLPVCTLVVLGDPSPTWRPDSYQEELLGCRHRLDFPVVKLEEFRADLPALEQSKNPFGPVVAAHLHTRTGGPDSDRRQRAKQRLVRQLHKSGFSSKDIRQLFRLIDWFLRLSERQAGVFWHNLEIYERKNNMPYITSVERIGIKKGLQQGLEQGLEQGRVEGRTEGLREAVRTVLMGRFPEVAEETLSCLDELTDRERLSSLALKAATAPTIDAFLAEL